MIPFISLNAVTSDGSGVSSDMNDVFPNHTVVFTVTGSPSGGQLSLEVSHDGSNWATVSGSPQGNLTTFSTGGWFTVLSVNARFTRVKLSGLTGGSTPTVTATVASSGR